MNWCNHFERLCLEALDRPLTSLEMAHMQFHLTICRNCREQNIDLIFIHNIWQNISELNAEIFECISLPENTKKRIQAKIVSMLEKGVTYE